MHHIARQKTGPSDINPFRLQCSCGTGGDFPSAEQLQAFVQMHFSRLGGIDDGEFLVGDAPSTYMQAPPLHGVRAVAPEPVPEPEPPQETVGDA